MKRIFCQMGFTLTELIVALAISAVVGVVATRQMMSALRFSSHTQEQFELEKAKITIARELRHVFSRARFIAASAGAVTFGADLRPCPAGGAVATPGQFNPITANGSNPFPVGTASSYTLVTFLCCPPPATAAVNVASPWGGVFPTPNRCRNGPGLSINYRRGAVNGGTCYGAFGRRGNETTNFVAGGSATTGANTFTQIRLQGAGYDWSREILTPTVLVDSAGNPSSNSYNAPVGANTLYYFLLRSNDTYATGEAPAQRARNPAPGPVAAITQREPDIVEAGADILRFNEYYGILANQANARLIDCNRGVDD